MKGTLINELEAIVGKEFVLTDPASLICYGYDGAFARGKPDVAVLPSRAEEVVEVMRIAARHRVPVFPRGSGSGLSGGSVPQGGLALVLTRMNRIKEIDAQNLTAVVEPGVITGHLQKAVEAQGLFYPPDPASARISTIGGNIAENAGGPRGFKYGVTGDYVLGLEAVLADGSVMRTGTKTRKNVSGYDLTSLLVGSEGTLGVVTEATLRLIPKPEAVATLAAVFDDLDRAGETIAALVAAGIVPATLEIMDRYCLECVEAHLRAGLPVDAAAMLLIEVDGMAEAVIRQGQRVKEICLAYGAREVREAKSREAAEELWQARRSISGALARLGALKVGEDATVPPAQVPAMIRRLQAIREKYGLKMVIFGHAGDGNLHPNIAADPFDAAEVERVGRAMEEIFAAALELGGVLSGEHGIGLLKGPFLQQYGDPVFLARMKAVKAAFDPENRLNPGKLGFPAVHK